MDTNRGCAVSTAFNFTVIDTQYLQSCSERDGGNVNVINGEESVVSLNDIENIIIITVWHVT